MIESYWHKETELRIGRVDKPHKKRHPALPDARLVQLLLEILASPVTACPFASHRHRGGVRFFRTREDPNHPPHVQGRRGQKAMLGCIPQSAFPHPCEVVIRFLRREVPLAQNLSPPQRVPVSRRPVI
jgi:hypothetical protein